MLRRPVVLVVFALAWVSFADRALADGFTVYVHDMRDGGILDGQQWTRSPYQSDVYSSFELCLVSVLDRVLTNWEIDADDEAFLILWTETRPQWGYLTRPEVEPPYLVVMIYYPIGNQNYFIYYLGALLGPYSGA